MQTDLKKELDSLVTLIQNFTKEGCFGCISERVFFTFYLLKRVSRIKYIVDKHMKTSINTLKEYLPYIKNILNNPYHNGCVEGNNNFIKVLKRIAFVFRSFHRFKARIMICKNLLHVKRVNAI